MNWRKELAEQIYYKLMGEAIVTGEYMLGEEEESLNLIEEEITKFEKEKIVRIYLIEEE